MSPSSPPPPPPNNDPLAGLLKSSPLVYRTLALSTVLASAGAYIHLNDIIPIIQGGLISLIVSIGSLLTLSFGYPFIRGDVSRTNIRSSIFGLFSFSYGLSLGPFLDTVIYISNESVVPTALLLTTIIFVSFSASAIFSQRRSFLFLGGILSSAIGIIAVLSLMNFFIGSQLLFNIDLYIGLLVFCGLLLFDTQMVIERVESSSEHRTYDDEYQHDTIRDALQLFMDAVSIFIRLATILAKNSQQKGGQNDDQNHRGSKRSSHLRG